MKTISLVLSSVDNYLAMKFKDMLNKINYARLYGDTLLHHFESILVFLSNIISERKNPTVDLQSTEPRICRTERWASFDTVQRFEDEGSNDTAVFLACSISSYKTESLKK